MRFELINERLCFSINEMREVSNTIASASAALQEARLKTTETVVIEKIDFALNRLIVALPQKLSIV